LDLFDVVEVSHDKLFQFSSPCYESGSDDDYLECPSEEISEAVSEKTPATEKCFFLFWGGGPERGWTFPDMGAGHVVAISRSW
jgi:hypothetical protein